MVSLDIREGRRKTEKSGYAYSFFFLFLFHVVSHNLKGLVARFGVRVVFRNHLKLSRLAPFSGVNEECGKKARGSGRGFNKMSCMTFPRLVVFRTLGRQAVMSARVY